MTTTDSIPQITCTKCGEPFPATLEFFYKKKRGKYGLYSYCKKCHLSMTIPNAKAWSKAHPERFKKTVKKYNDKPERKEKVRSMYRENPEKHRALVRQRRARILSLPATFTHEQWQRCLEWWNNTCAYCGAQQSFWHVLEQEHFIPVSKGGGYIAVNVIPACRPCNSAKRTALATEWLTRRHKGNKRRVDKILARITAYFEWVKSQPTE